MTVLGEDMVGELRELAGAIDERIGQLTDQLATATERSLELQEKLDEANNQIVNLEIEIAELGDADEVIEWIADVRRGLLTIDELYERALG